jgi:predicted phage gp36 major capsid-like protein
VLLRWEGSRERLELVSRSAETDPAGGFVAEDEVRAVFYRMMTGPSRGIR